MVPALSTTLSDLYPDFKVMTFFDIEYLNKKLSWCWQIRATRLEVIVSSCATVTLALRHAVFTTVDFKNMSWPWNRG